MFYERGMPGYCGGIILCSRNDARYTVRPESLLLGNSLYFIKSSEWNRLKRSQGFYPHKFKKWILTTEEEGLVALIRTHQVEEELNFPASTVLENKAPHAQYTTMALNSSEGFAFLSEFSHSASKKPEKNAYLMLEKQLNGLKNTKASIVSMHSPHFYRREPQGHDYIQNINANNICYMAPWILWSIVTGRAKLPSGWKCQPIPVVFNNPKYNPGHAMGLFLVKGDYTFEEIDGA